MMRVIYLGLNIEGLGNVIVSSCYENIKTMCKSKKYLVLKGGWKGSKQIKNCNNSYDNDNNLLKQCTRLLN